MLEALSLALESLMTPGAILFLLLGTVIGYVFGILPGLGGTAALALALGLLFGMEPAQGFLFMAGIMGTVAVGGSVTAILLNTPGTAVSAATCLDGYPMAQRGEAGRALSVAAIASGAGELVGLLVLLALIPVVRAVILAFSPAEFFMLILMGLATIGVAVRGNVIKGLLSAVMGLLLSFIGFSTITGAVRFSFGVDYLWNGLPLVPLFIGLFALGEMLILAAARRTTISQEAILIKGGKVEALKDVFIRFRGCFVRSSVIGTIIGIIPGVGGSVANWVAYLLGKQFSKTPEKFGTGWPEGVVASESANNAKDGGSILPTIAFGLPGSAEMAVFLGGVSLLGLKIGPTILLDHLDLVLVLILGLFISAILGTLVTLFLADALKIITTVNMTYIIPVVIALCFVGSYALNQNMIDVLVMIIFGVISYVMRRSGFSVVPMVIGFILGVLAERSLFQTLIISDGSYAIFFTRPISLTLFIFTIIILALPFIKRRKKGAAATG